MRTLRVIAVTAVLALGTGLGPAPVSAEPGARATEAELSRFATWFLWDTQGTEPIGTQVDALVRRLQQGTGRGVLAREAVRSHPWAANVVDDLYLHLLRRPSDASGRAYWVGRLQGGMPVGHLTVGLLASPEYYTDATDEALVSGFYQDILRRFPSTGDRDYWIGRLRAGVGRSTVVSAIHRTSEARRIRADRLYRDLMGRRAAPAEATYWGGRLVREDDMVLAAHLLASAEYFARAQVRLRPVGPPTILTATPDPLVDRWSYAVSDDGRVIVELVGDDETTGVDATDLVAGTTERIFTFAGPPFGNEGFEGLDVSGDGDLVAVAVGRTVHLVDRSAGTVTEVGRTPGTTIPARPVLSSDGTTLAFAGASEGDTDQSVVVHDIATGDDVLVEGDHGFDVEPSLSGDGRFLVFTSTDAPFLSPSTVHLHDRVAGTTTRVTPATSVSDQPVISADGSTVVLRSNAAVLAPGDPLDDGSRADVYAWTRATGTFRRLSWGDTDGRSPTVSADGGRIAFLEQRRWPDDPPTRVVWSRATGRTLVLLTDGPVLRRGGSLDELVMTADGRHVVARSGDGGGDVTIERWDLPA